MKNNFANLNPNRLNTEKSDEDSICILRFAYCHNKYPLEKLSGKDLKALMNFFKKIEVMTWKEIKIDDGLNYEIPKHFNVSMPDFFPKDATPVSFRVTQKFRIIGWRESYYLNILWFDKNHLSYSG